MNGVELARAAESFVGRPFRLHGRDPATGLDCIGLIEASLTAIGCRGALPNGYTLRTFRWNGLDSIASERGFSPALDDERPGDICLLAPSPTQMHFAIAGLARSTRVEAHAGLRRVVLSVDDGQFPTIRRWRLA